MHVQCDGVLNNIKLKIMKSSALSRKCQVLQKHRSYRIRLDITSYNSDNFVQFKQTQTLLNRRKHITASTLIDPLTNCVCIECKRVETRTSKANQNNCQLKTEQDTHRVLQVENALLSTVQRFNEGQFYVLSFIVPYLIIDSEWQHTYFFSL